MTTKEEIKIFKLAKKELFKTVYNGLCMSINNAVYFTKMLKTKKSEASFIDLEECDRIEDKLIKKYFLKYKPKDKNMTEFWFPVEDRQTRINILDEIISKLEEKLKNEL